MSTRHKKTISIIVPVYNESGNIEALLGLVQKTFDKLPYELELVFVNDGSADDSLPILRKLEKKQRFVRVLDLSRNFGKEIAVTAGLNHCTGDAAIMIDADLQHPVTLIPVFIQKWEEGAEVVVGVRKAYTKNNPFKRLRSWLFYATLNKVAHTKVTRNATDFRLLDRAVIDEFNRFSERNRMTRGLIDWLGFRREYVPFTANERQSGTANYSTAKLIRLAVNSFVSLSLLPLKVAGYLGILITLLSSTAGIFVLLERYAFNNYFGLFISGSAALGILIIFLVGIVLSSLGLIALYIANIHEEVLGRPLYALRSPRK